MVTLRGFPQVAFLMLVAAGFGAARAGHAQPFPSNTIRIVVPTVAGTPPDIISRVVAAELAEAEGWRTLVENRPGALQTIGMSDVLKQPADGYSIYPMSVPTMVVPAPLPHLGLRPDVDFTPIVKVSRSYNVLVVPPTFRRNRSQSSLLFSRNSLDGTIFHPPDSARLRISPAKCSSCKPA
jgi:tripartite-type tricarboxylate transporter receptor subunit TctC